MTRSSTNELFTPYKEPEREFRSSRRHFKTLSLDELRSPDFNILSDQEYSEEEKEEAMAEIMEQYMSKTRTDYGSGVARPKIDNKDQFELKGQFLKELRENMFSGSDNEDANEHIEKVLEIVDLFHVLNITVDQQMLRVFPISLTGATSRWLRNEPTSSIKTWEDLKTKFLNKYCPPGRIAKKMEEIKNFQQEPDETLFQAWERFKELLMKCPQHYLTEMQKERGFGSLPSSTETNPRDQVKSISTTTEADSYSIRRIGSSQYAVSTRQNSTLLYKSRQMTVPFPSRLDNHYCEEEEGNYGPKFTEAYGASHINDTIPQKEKDPGSFTLPCFINKTCFDNALVDLGASISVMPLSTYLNLGLGELAHTRLTVELADRTVKYPKGIAKNVLVGIGKFTFPVDFIILDMPEDIKVPLILGRPFLSTARAKIDVYKRKITLRVREERIIFKSVKPASSLIKRVYMLSLRERMELDLEARLMGETLVLNRSLDPFLEDYIELNDLNEPFELRRNQGDDFMPTVEEGKIIEEFRTRDEDLDTGIDNYPSYCDDDKKIHIDCAYNLKFTCMIGFEFTYVNFYPLLYVNEMSKEFHNSIMKDKMVYKGDNVIGALMNAPIFVGTFSVMTDFAVLEDMDAYRDKGMGDIIVGEPFLRKFGIKTKRFKGMITIYNGDDEVTDQMVLPSSVLSEKSPFEMIYEIKPKLSHIRCFGCLCYSTVLNNGDKFSSISTKCVLIGFSTVKKAYKLYSLDDKTVLYPRDLNFLDNFDNQISKSSYDEERATPNDEGNIPNSRNNPNNVRDDNGNATSMGDKSISNGNSQHTQSVLVFLDQNGVGSNITSNIPTENNEGVDPAPRQLW
ncbi:hypothetical protein Tco_0427909 [Tanacetum coccineum]